MHSLSKLVISYYFCISANISASLYFCQRPKSFCRSPWSAAAVSNCRQLPPCNSQPIHIFQFASFRVFAATKMLMLL